MSMGIGANATLISEDKEYVIYKYGSYNLNEPEYRNESQLCDGEITISRNCFSEPEIHEKNIRTSGGKKKQITKRIIVDVDCAQMIEDGRIVIKNCSNCWQCSSETSIDIMAIHILGKLFRQYQEDGKMPECISYNV